MIDNASSKWNTSSFRSHVETSPSPYVYVEHANMMYEMIPSAVNIMDTMRSAGMPHQSVLRIRSRADPVTKKKRCEMKKNGRKGGGRGGERG